VEAWKIRTRKVKLFFGIGGRINVPWTRLDLTVVLSNAEVDLTKEEVYTRSLFVTLKAIEIRMLASDLQVIESTKFDPTFSPAI